MYSVVSYCQHCSAPIYIPSIWGGVIPPAPTYTCTCRFGRYGTYLPGMPIYPHVTPMPWDYQKQPPYWDMLSKPMSNNQQGNVDNMIRQDQDATLEKYRITDEQREAWKRASGRLTGNIPHGEDGETLSE